MSILVRYTWPGNMRELEKVLERALVLSGGEVETELLPAQVGSATSPFRIPQDGDALSVKRRLPALERTAGNRTRAAEILELSTRALTYKIQDCEL